MRKRHKLRKSLLVGGAVFAGYVGVLALVTAYKICRIKAKAKPPGKSRFEAWQTDDCQPIPKHIYRRPDPLIYSQQYLMSQGLAVTWNNPDIHLEQGGVPVDSSDLKPGTTYDVIARIWNGSLDAPVAGLPVHVSYLSFGIATGEHPVAVTAVDLGAKAAPGCPTFAQVQWTTPAQPGHYCLLVRLIWADDANPANNVGQHNTQVKPLNSPRAVFDFAVANPGRQMRQIRLAADSYVLPELPPCNEQAPPDTGGPNVYSLAVRKRQVLARHNAGSFPVPAGWTVNMNPQTLQLGPSEERQVSVEIIAPDGFTGRRSFNINGFVDNDLLGGVTLIVTA